MKFGALNGDMRYFVTVQVLRDKVVSVPYMSLRQKST